MDKDMRSKLDFARFICQNLSDQIRQADTKAAAVFSVLGIMTAGLLSRITNIKVRLTDWPIESLVIYGIAGLLLIISLKSAIAIIFPRLSKGKKESLIFFGDIVNFKKKDYEERVLKIDDEKIVLQYSNQAAALSAIALKKFTHLRQAFILTAVTLAWVIFILIFY